ncbi:substrate-binding periplasmic protein [Aquipseudomonas ullengensis]|uniref:Transporter substrate-binding domain-containing protein n=1 Tax=Aquipseudomonas ullengensis TaxID=2759166 RepID=A0A7W4QBC0_9GAMM|nr:transporter substrate-binding domain-containing protein [Pseudomonas ullengensis]MBB2496529.1 transporter substrate-binding domain-containing protein [Pseudomonas ullengensis]
MGWTTYRYRQGCIGLLLAGILGSAQADEAAQRYGCAKPIRLAWFQNSIVYRDGKGFDPDLVAELQRRSGCVFDTQQVPRSEVWSGLAEGWLDMLPSGVPNLERRRYSFFIPSVYFRNKLIVRADLAAQVTTFSDFQKIPDARLGSVRGYWNGPYYEAGVRALYGAGRVREYVDDAERYAALRRGEVNGLISHDINLQQQLPAEEQLNYRVLDLSPGPSLAVGLMLSRRTFSAAQAAEWMRLVEGMRLDGRLAEMIRANMPEHLAGEFLNSGYRYELSKRGNGQ